MVSKAELVKTQILATGLSKNIKGFTLLELVLVLFLMGLIMGLALPFVVKTLDHVKLQSEARRIASAIQFARSEAISKKILFTVSIMFLSITHHRVSFFEQK